jgi:hypothetical protein
MSETIHTSTDLEPVEGCVVEFLDADGIAFAAYSCGKCDVIASRDSDGLTYTDRGECEDMLYDASEPDYDTRWA